MSSAPPHINASSPRHLHLLPVSHHATTATNKPQCSSPQPYEIPKAIAMSAESTPITAARFASALNDLPISSLYAKHAELTNSITHLESSNKQLEDFARENDDRDCYEALLENRQVMKNFNERMELIRKEVEEVRGLPWRPQNEGEVRKEEGAVGLNGTAPAQNGISATAPTAIHAPSAAQGQTSDSAAHTGEDEEGVHL
jgi:hypothetical protein